MESSGGPGDAECMDDAPGLPKEWLPQLRRARAALTVSDEIGLALRDHRRRLGMSQRTYATTRGLSRAMLARLEAGAGRMSLDTVVKALDGTGFVLQVGFSPDHPSPPPADDAGALAAPDAESAVPLPGPSGVPPETWAPTDLVARVRGRHPTLSGAPRGRGGRPTRRCGGGCTSSSAGRPRNPSGTPRSATWTSPADC